ncbi:MAG: ribonuclease HII [Oscillospiraceae bacterium]|nr:ribonuclease HII [Oscillospiraceae bacterium]
MTDDLFEYDRSLRLENGIFCGIDEAGRGPLAGDVYAAAVVFDDDTFIEGINDSKKLSEKKRSELYDIIIQKAAAYSVGTASAAEIDEHNILRATFIAMRRAYEGLGIKPSFAIVDGNRDPSLGIRTMTVVKGDGISASIAAASIIAKVSRDRYMTELAEKYPEYQFEKHKGYPTKLHYEMIRQYGPSPVHRMSFLKKMH